MSLRIAVSGATGRMGRTILDLAAADPRYEIVGALEIPSHNLIGYPLVQALPEAGFQAKKTVIQDLLAKVEPKPRVLIDFTHPQATMGYLKEAQSLGVGMVIGTTGLTNAEKKKVRSAAKKIAIVMAPNMGVGMNLLFSMVEDTARQLGMDYDVEITEAHHNQKKDAPSGTALGLGEAVARAWKVDLDKVATHGRKGLTGKRVKGTIGFHAIRGGDIVGDHTVLFAGPGERLELTHRAHSRNGLARGALKAALFLAGKKSGFYDMQDVLKLR